MKTKEFGIWSVLLSLALAVAVCQAKGPRSAKDYYNRGVERYQNGNLDWAIVDFNHALELNPRCAKAYNARGAAWYALGFVEEALADFDAAVEISPWLPLAYVGRAGHVVSEG